MIDPNSSQTDDSPSIETLMFKAGLISADDLGELVRDAVVAQRPVAALAIERNLVTPRALETLLAQARGDDEPAAAEPVGAAEPAPVEPEPDPEPALVAPVVPVTPAAAPVAAVVQPLPTAAPPVAPAAAAALAFEPQPEPAAAAAPAPQPEPVEPRPLHAVEPTPASVAYDVLVRLTTGDTVRVGDAASREEAEQLARETAQRFRDAAEWPLVGGRFLRPDVVVSVDLLRRLED